MSFRCPRPSPPRRGAACALPPGPQVTRQLPAQRPTALHIQRLVNRLTDTRISGRSGNSSTSLALTCSGDQFPISLACTHSRSSSLTASFAAWAAAPAPAPPAPPDAPGTPRPHCSGAPPGTPSKRCAGASRAAIRRYGSFCASPTAISSRSHRARNRPDPPRAIPLHPARSNHPPPRRLTPRPRRPRSLLHTQTRTNPVPEHHLHLTRQHRTTQPHHNEPPHRKPLQRPEESA